MFIINYFIFISCTFSNLESRRDNCSFLLITLLLIEYSVKRDFVSSSRNENLPLLRDPTSSSNSSSYSESYDSHSEPSDSVSPIKICISQLIENLFNA